MQVHTKLKVTNVTGCTTKIGKICTHITPKCANCEGNHQATAFKCPARLKAQTEEWKKKVKKSQLREKQPITNESPDERPVLRQIDMHVDTKATSWAKSLEAQFLDLSSVDGDLPEDFQDKW